MKSRTLPASVKSTSALRRMPSFTSLRYLKAFGREGNVCAFKLTGSAHIIVESVTGRAMTLVPGNVFLGTPGYRESTRWVVGGVPRRGLMPGKKYWVLAQCGVVGDLVAGTPVAKSFLGQAIYLGAVAAENGRMLALGQFALQHLRERADYGAPVYLIVGTSAEVGKTTAGIVTLQTLLKYGHTRTVVLKATGTSAVAEIALYEDHGASHVFDCVDFGVPSTYSPDRVRIGRMFENALDICLSVPADAVLVECGGDLLGA